MRDGGRGFAMSGEISGAELGTIHTPGFVTVFKEMGV